MKKMNRVEFLKMSSAIAATPLFSGPLVTAIGKNSNSGLTDDDLMQKLVTANDKEVGILLSTVKEDDLEFSRRTGSDLAVLSASYCYANSKYYHEAALVSKMKILVEFIAAAQTGDGTVNIGNLESPPDTAFLVEILCSAAVILQKDGSAELMEINKGLKAVLQKAGDALAVGGVHTPNHRWVISAALSQLNGLYPDKKYRDRIANWLGEGVYIDKDGHFPERSGTYSSVETTSFITIARLMNKPGLLDPVRKNLEMFRYYMEGNGDLVYNDSRRQDQYAARTATLFYLQYRYMAINDRSGRFAGIVRWIESLKDFENGVLKRSLFLFLENETLQKQLPSPVLLEDSYEKLFSTSHLLRIKRNKTTMTLFGGADWPVIIASGRSNSPDFFSYRKGEAILKYMRLSSGFFSMGYFYSEGLQKTGTSYVLHKKITVPYYQPLPEAKRKKDGDYALSESVDGRFWNKMDFKDRPVSNVKTLDTTITFTEKEGKAVLNIVVDGLKNVPVTIELCFTEGGKLAGDFEEGKEGLFLKKDNASYQFGEDTIQFGPGTMAFKRTGNLEGERYSTHFGSLRTEGMHVFLTGTTPFNHTLQFS